MANKVSVPFALDFVADGVSDKVMADTASSPFGFQVPGAYTVLSSVFSAVPSNAINMSCSSGASVTASFLLGVVTFTLSSAPAAGSYQIYGTFEY